MSETVVVDVAPVARMLDKARDQVPFAVALGLTRLAQAIQKTEKDTIKQVFDRPTPFTQNSPVIRPATKDNPVAKVFIRDEATKGTPPSKYLQPQVFGGPRPQKRSEVAISRVAGQNVYVVPATGKLNQYGNIQAGEIQKVLASLGVSEYAQKAIAKKRGRTLEERGIKYFVGKPGGGRLPYGVWVRQGRTLQPVLIIIPQPSYAARFPFFEVAIETAKKQMWRIMMDAEDVALKTAR